MKKKRVMAVVAAHVDDSELALGGTIQKAVQGGFEVVVLVIAADPNDPKRTKANQETSRLLGYTLLLGGISDKRISVQRVHKIVDEKLIVPYGPRIDMVFLHHPLDENHHHVLVAQGSRSACRAVINKYYFTGPRGLPDLRPDTFVPFGTAEMKMKLETLKIMEAAYGSTRYFTEPPQRGWSVCWGEWLLEYWQRHMAPAAELFGRLEEAPYAEIFQVDRQGLIFVEEKIGLFSPMHSNHG